MQRFRTHAATRKPCTSTAWRFSPGETVAVMGPVGSGKSTLLKVLAALHTPSTGQLMLDGVDVTQISPADFRCARGLGGADAVMSSR